MFAVFTIIQKDKTIDINSLNVKAMNDVFEQRKLDFTLMQVKGKVNFRVKLCNKISIDQIIALAKLYNQKQVIFINKKNNNEVIYI